MGEEDVKARQGAERENCLQSILDSPARRKLVIGGPGTGKTYTFRKVLEQREGGNNLAMTFINALVDDMQADLADYSEVKTFHAYCKKILHKLRGGVELVPYLTKIIEGDAEILGRQMANFKTHFQMLDENSPEVAFYLSRADYYDVVSFDDSVYRVYQRLKTDPSVVPEFDQILVDEFQDFNPLEVAFIGELEKHGPIIIAGDDDQAVYDQRCASPDYLRQKHYSGEYAVFELPFCSRCPEVIVAATNALVEGAQSRGHLVGRIQKRHECYLLDKEDDSLAYPAILTAECSTARVIPKYLAQEIAAIPAEDIEESHREDNEYPTVLVVGRRQYLRETENQLQATYPQLSYSPSIEPGYDVVDGYEQILRDEHSNLAWRIIMECFTEPGHQKKILAATENGAPMIDLLDSDFLATHLRAVEIVKAIREGEMIGPNTRIELERILGDYAGEVVDHFSPHEEDMEEEIDRTQPSILLTSFVGCKGLSAGHVFIIGAHNAAIPKDPGNIEDVEISQFIVALTRARKRCHIVSNRWLFSPKDGNDEWLPAYTESEFISWIPSGLVEDRGYLKASSFD